MVTKKYETLEKIVDLGSLSKAAEELGLTQPGVSHILAGLEEEMGVPLLRRTRVGVRLTPEGERLMPLIREINRAETRLEEEVAELRGVSGGTVRIGTFTSVAVNWLPGIMQEFQALYPGVEFKLLNGDYHDVDRWITEGSVDAAFITLPTDLRCECVPLKEDRLLAILPPGHPLAGQQVCRVTDVAVYPFISLLETSDNDARHALESAGVRPNVRFTTKDDYAIIAMVSRGLGVSIMPELLLKGWKEGIEARPLDPPSSRMLALAVPAGDRSGPATRRFVEFVKEWTEKNA